MDPRARTVAAIPTCDDPDKLKRYAANAAAAGDSKLEAMALRRLYAVLPSADPGTLEHDVWQSIHGLEDTLGRERGRTTRLSRTRQKITRDGEAKTVADLVLGKPSEGFEMLIERGLTDLTFERVALRHRERFDTEVLAQAERRLSEIPPRQGNAMSSTPVADHP